MGRLTTQKPLLATVDTRTARPAPKTADAHYQTPEHKAWRLEVMRRAGWRCQALGCRRHHPERLFADHIVEIRHGGDPLDPANGQALCGEHHSLKTAQQRAKRMGLT